MSYENGYEDGYAKKEAEVAAEITALRERVKRMEEALRDTFDPLQHMVVCQKRLMDRCMCNECIEERARASLKEGE